MKQFNCKEKDAFILKNYKKMTNLEMANQLKCSKSTISNRRKKLGISWTELNFNIKEKKEEIVSLYIKQGKTKSQIAKKFNCSPSFIKKILNEEKTFKSEGQRYSFNENCFDKIDTSNKAYILGIIASDGCLYRRDGHQGQVNISFQKTDVELIEKIKKEFNSNHIVSVGEKMATLSLVSDHFFNSVLNIGIGVRKTFDLNISEIFEKIPLKFNSDFIRGYFDGDGSIGHSSTGAGVNVRISAPKNSCLDINDKLNFFGINMKYYSDKRKYSHEFGNLECSNISEKYNFLKFIYFNEGVCLNRKKELANDFFKKVELNITNRKENIKAINCYAEVVVKWDELLGSL